MWLSDNLGIGLISVGLILLVIEIAVLGFSTFVLFFVGGAAVITGLLMQMGVVEDTNLNATLYVSLFTALLAVFLWKPLKNMQKDVDPKKASNDLIGLTFIVAADISAEKTGMHRYSGINWRVVSQDPIASGTKVEVIAVDVGQFTIKPCK
ncbi:NfeD family protein [uncultured Paraglaciecola sp.]|uniref:NfeD family protein n=1 Tax=uncultured Paraglaciecola sp. TaxID=1765024 RepID=UPI0030DBAB69|tara:strand:+ start:446 stop:898 length:453 start_codon:yes stop_codon:yes gene_type:complete